MDGQGMAASPAPAGGRRGEVSLGSVAAAETDHPTESYVASDIAGGGEVRWRNGDDSHVMVAPGHPEASGQDVAMSQSPDSRSPDSRLPREEHPSQESQAELPSQQIKPDKADNIVDPDRDD